MEPTVADLVVRRADDGNIGVRFEDQQWTWREVVEEATARAAWLDDVLRVPDAETVRATEPPGGGAATTGLRGRETRNIGVLLENTPEYLFLLCGAALAGAVVVGINPTRRGAELARDIRHTDCQLIVTDSAQRAHLDGLDTGVESARVFIEGSPSYRDVVASHRGAPVPATLPSPSDLYLLIFTSGSTGAPKAVRMTHGRAAGIAKRVPFTSDDVLYVAMPLFHGNSLNAAVFPALATGASVVLRRRFSASGFLDDVRRHHCTFFNTVGRAIAHINATPPTEHDRDHQLKWVLGPETAEVDKAAFTARFGVPIFEGYGSSENAIILNPAPGARAGALGTAPAGADVAVVDSATHEECATAEFDDDGRLLNADEAIGELVGRNLSDRFEGYYNNPEAEAERRHDGWYWSGDLAYRDADGVFYFAGRAGDWLRVDSENFAAAPVERILARVPGVAGVAVYAVPDAVTGDQVMAAIELVDGTTFDPDAFAASLAEQRDLGPKWVPRYIRIVDHLPLTATNKLDKSPLRAVRWRTDDPIWHRPPRTDRYVPFTADDRAALEADFAANGRTNLLL